MRKEDKIEITDTYNMFEKAVKMCSELRGHVSCLPAFNDKDSVVEEIEMIDDWLTQCMRATYGKWVSRQNASDARDKIEDTRRKNRERQKRYRERHKA